MAKVRGITKHMLTDVKANIRKYEYHIEDGTQYTIAQQLMKDHKDILYCYYWDDIDEKNHGGYTYPIERSY